MREEVREVNARQMCMKLKREVAALDLLRTDPTDVEKLMIAVEELDRAIEALEARFAHPEDGP